MEIIGYVAYVSLIMMAIAWTINVRISPNTDTPGILRAVYFVLSIIVIPAFDMNMAHALWMVPFGCFFAKIIAPALISIPVLSVPFIIIADGFASFVRIGLADPEIQEATEG